MSIASLLQQSQDEHLAYREALPRRIASGGGGTVAVAGDAELAGIHLAAACRFRAEAHVLDPGQTDPAWSDEALAYDHTALLDFYVAQLTAEPTLVQDAAVDVDLTIEEARGALRLPVPVVAPDPEPVTIQINPPIVAQPPALSPPSGVLGK